MIEQTISHYRVIDKIGEGGMGEVYRAHDTKLSRDVALKVLPQIFAQDSQLMAQFEREAVHHCRVSSKSPAQIPRLLLEGV